MLPQFESLTEMLKRFPDEQSCIDYLTEVRWCDGVFCPYCGSRKVYHFKNQRIHKCGDCRKKFSIKIGTIFEDTKIPLQKWFMAIYFITSHKKGISSVQLGKDIGITQKSAWFMAHILREATKTRAFKQPKSTQEKPLILDMPFGEALERFSRVNTRISESEPSPKSASPFVKWAGGKRNIIDDLVKHLPTSFGDYYEPFVGGAALFFEINSRLKQAHLSDINLDLAITFAVVKKTPEILISKLEEHERKNSEDYYYKVRAQYDLQDPIDIAARFIYLNKTCYNGLYRVNKKGEFNVPRGSSVNPNIVQRANILACSKALQKAKIEYREFDTIKPHQNDFVYFDPPYHPSDINSFTKYTKLDFSEKDQERLRDFALELNKAGVKVMLSNSDTTFIRRLYASNIWHIDTVQAPRMVNCKPEGRGVVNELLITNYPTTPIQQLEMT